MFISFMVVKSDSQERIKELAQRLEGERCSVKITEMEGTNSTEVKFDIGAYNILRRRPNVSGDDFLDVIVKEFADIITEVPTFWTNGKI
jgi:hypothetical protein